MSVLIRYQPVERWPCDSTMSAKTSLKNSVAGQAPLGSLTSMRKSPPSLQVYRSAWSSTMSSTMLATNSSVPLPRLLQVPGGCSKMEILNTLTRCRSWRAYHPRFAGKNLRNNRPPPGGGNSTRPHRTLVRGETKTTVKADQGRLDRPHGGQILCENKRGPLVYSIAKTFHHPLVMPLRLQSS